MLRNDTIQAGLVEEFKSLTPVSTLLGGTTEIRESQWQGTQFSYPAIRVDVQTQVPSIEGCAYGWIDATVSVYSEKASSQECDTIAGTVFQNLRRSFTRNGVFFSGMRCSSLGGAYRINEQTWKADVRIRGMAVG